MLEFEILARGLYRPDQLDILYDPSLRTSILPDIQQWMDTLWQKKLAMARRKNIPLYDAPLFRLVSAEARPDGRLSLVLGDTSYKEYVTTREKDFAHWRDLKSIPATTLARLATLSRDARRERHELGNPLSVCSVVETSDSRILLDKRKGVDTYVGRYHVIGGFFERSLDTDSQNMRPDPFAAICRERREETGLQLADIAEQYCLGAVYDLTLPHAELCFFTRLNIPLAEVRQRIPEEQEIKQLHSRYVTAESLYAFIAGNHGKISPTGEPNLLMYGAMKFGEEWLNWMMADLEHPEDFEER